MPYRRPRYCHLHVGRDLGVGAISLTVGSEHADFPLDNLIDNDAGTLFRFSASAASPTIVFDLGASFITGVSRIFIPGNHNITSILILDDDNAAMSSAATLNALDSVSSGSQIDFEFDTSTSTQRYIGVHLFGTKQYELSQIFLTKTVTTGVGPTLSGAVDEKRDNALRLDQPTGRTPTVQLGPQQRLITYDYEDTLIGADLATMEALISEVGMDKPFYVDPASFSATPGADQSAVRMKLDSMPRSRNTISVPMNGTRRKSYRLDLIESFD